jgi:hypothetical protein
MLLPNDRDAMSRPVLVESINTGAQWRMDEDELPGFFIGRNRRFYRVFRK